MTQNEIDNSIYKRILAVMLEATQDEELDIILRKAQIETLAEVASNEAENIIRDTQELLKSRILEFLIT